MSFRKGSYSITGSGGGFALTCFLGSPCWSERRWDRWRIRDSFGRHGGQPQTTSIRPVKARLSKHRERDEIIAGFHATTKSLAAVRCLRVYLSCSSSASKKQRAFFAQSLLQIRRSCFFSGRDTFPVVPLHSANRRTAMALALWYSETEGCFEGCPFPPARLARTRYPNPYAHSLRRAGQRQQRSHLLLKSRQIVFQNAPYGKVLDDCVPVNQHVAEADDLWQRGNGLAESRVPFLGLHQRFANDDKLAFHTRSQEGVGLIVRKRFAACEGFQKGRGSKPGDTRTGNPRTLENV